MTLLTNWGRNETRRLQKTTKFQLPGNAGSLYRQRVFGVGGKATDRPGKVLGNEKITEIQNLNKTPSLF